MQLRTLVALVVMLVAQALARAQEFGLVDAAVGTNGDHRRRCFIRGRPGKGY